MEAYDCECLLENDPLAIYLKSQQFDDFETASIRLKKVSKPVSVVKKENIISSDNGECQRYIDQILKSELLLEEDYTFLDNINETPILSAKVSMNKTLFFATLLSIGYAFTRYSRTCTYYLLPKFITLFCAVPLFMDLYCIVKCKLKINRLVLLLRELKQMTKLSRKCLTTVAEYSASLGYYSANSINCSCSSLNNMYIRFAKHFYGVLLNMTNSLAWNSTQICSMIPLSIENRIMYSSKEDLLKKEDVNLTDLRNMFELYVLVQSDFLKSLGLSFCKYLWLDCRCNNSKLFSEVLPSLINTIKCNISILEKELSLLLKFGASETSLTRNPRKIKNLPITYMISCLHNAEINFQQLFCKSRDLQDVLDKLDDLEQINPSNINILLNEMEKQLTASRNTVDTVIKYYNQRQNHKKEENKLELPECQSKPENTICECPQDAEPEKLSYELYIPKEGLQDLIELEVEFERPVFNVKDLDYCGSLLEELRTALKSRNPDVFEQQEQDKNNRKRPNESDDEDSSSKTVKQQIFWPNQPLGLAENLQSIDYVLTTKEFMIKREFIEETFGNSDTD